MVFSHGTKTFVSFQPYPSTRSTPSGVIWRRMPSEVDSAEQRSNSVRRRKILFGINFTPLWRIIAVDFKHYDIKISVFAVTAERVWFFTDACFVVINAVE